MEVKKLEVPEISKENVIEIIEELKHCAYTYIEDEEDEENIKAYTVLGIVKKMLEKVDVDTLKRLYNEFRKEVEISNIELFKK